MGLRDEQVFPAIVVVIEKVCAPAGESQSGVTHAGRVGHIAKRAGALIAKQHIALVGEIRHDDIGQAIVVVVAEVDSHACEGLAVFVVAHAGEQADFAKRAVAIVVIEETLHRIVRYKNIGKTIAVVVGKGNSEPLATRIGDSGLLRNIGESTVAVVVIEDIRQAVVVIGVAVGTNAVGR